MNVDKLIQCLEYADAPFYLDGSHLNDYPGYAHAFRLAQDQCALHGVYILAKPAITYTSSATIVPLVYVCEAATEEQAIEFHRLVWNQNVVPFLIVLTPRTVRLYPGFRFEPSPNVLQDPPLLEFPSTINQVMKKLADFTSKSIDRGDIWKGWYREVTTETRVDRRLLKSLKTLGAWLQQHNLPPNVAHALIGKYVYFHYLKDRKILSDRKFEQWKIDKESVFGRQATLSGFFAVTKKLDEWLNGTVFPIPGEGKSVFGTEHLRKVSGTFLGDDPGTDQMHLDFKAYNFEHIPIETLSMVYQEFLHSEGKGKEKGAYYTPVHLANVILDELHAKRALDKATKIFDPACGSGVFIVQCYRRLIELEIKRRHEKRLRPSQLGELLVDNIYGMDVDEDACGITELSLVLTLLDYVDPPDLENPNYRNFKLPLLRNHNIFHSENGFFEPSREFHEARPRKGFDWIVGNPPWKKLNVDRLEKGDSAALSWINRNSNDFPVGNYQLAEAFAWHATQYISPQGVIGLLMPASTLFNVHAHRFRRHFFRKTKTWCVVNFSNLRHILFHGAASPAAAFFYSFPADMENERKAIITYAPFAVTQMNQYGTEERTRKKLWTILISADQIREVSQVDAASGDSDPWKFSMWGSPRDKRLLESVAKRFLPLFEFARLHHLAIHEGLQLRSEEADEQVEPLPEIIGKKELNMSIIRGHGAIYSFPDGAVKVIDPSRAYVRKGRGQVPLKICYPPHVIVNEGRRFAVFSDEFIVVPPRQVGIAGDKSCTDLLRALALYLSSDFAIYQQYITSPGWGIERDHFNEKDLEQLPIPLDRLSPKGLAEWVELHDKMVRVSTDILKGKELFFGQSEEPAILAELRSELNERAYDLLDLDEQERWLVGDFLSVRMKLNEGGIVNEAIGAPTEEEIRGYAGTLKKELDEFLDSEALDEHRVTVYFTKESALLKVEHPESLPAGPVRVVKAYNKTAREKLETFMSSQTGKRSQWIYFDRNVKLFEGRTTYFIKPFQRINWLKSQALLDADEFIAEKLT